MRFAIKFVGKRYRNFHISKYNSIHTGTAQSKPGKYPDQLEGLYLELANNTFISNRTGNGLDYFDSTTGDKLTLYIDELEGIEVVR